MVDVYRSPGCGRKPEVVLWEGRWGDLHTTRWQSDVIPSQLVKVIAVPPATEQESE